MHSHVFIIWLAATTAAAVEGPSDLRRPRQLDLGPDTNTIGQQAPINPTNTRQSSFQQDGYLPPIEPAGAQDDPVLLKPTQAPQTPTHHGRDLCTDPFHSFLCANLKPRRPITGNLPGQKTFSGNSLFGANSFLEPSKVLAPPLNDLEEPLTTTTRTEPPTTSTTSAPTTTRRPTTTTTRRPTTIYRPPPTTARPPPPPTTTTTTTERPIGPEASSDVRSYLPPDRIDPAAAQPDIAVVKPDNPEEHDHHHPHHHGRDLCSDPFHSFLCEPLKPRKRITGNVPNSLQGQNSFIDPQRVRPEPEVSPQPSNEIDRAYLPPSTTRRPTTTTARIAPQPSNEIDRVYLPPSTTRRPTTTYRPPPPPPRFIPQQSIRIDNAYLPPSTTTRRPLPTTTIRFRPEPSNEITRSYLPPITTRPTTTTPRPTTTTPRPTPPIIPQPSSVDRSYLPPVDPQPSNVDNTFLRPEPKIEPAAAQNDPSIAAPDHEHHHHHGSHGFKDICSDPFHSFLCVSPKPRKRITGELPARFRINSITPAPSNIDESRIRLINRKPEKLRIVVNPKDVETPQPSQQQDTKIPFPSSISPNYNYPKPELKLTLPSESREVGYTYPKPSTPKPVTTTAYSYPKKDKLTLPSQTNEVFGYNYPKPAKPLVANKGYSYPKPDNKLTLPSDVKEVIGYDYPKPTTQRPTTTARPTTFRTTTTQRPTTTPTTTKAVTYSYPKPETKLTLPSELKQVVGYDYPKPSIPFPPPTQGYSYPKPENKLKLPIENKQPAGYDYPKPTVGFALPTRNSFPKPDQSLTQSTEQKVDFRATSGLTNAQRIANSYAKPVSTASPSKSILPTSIQEAKKRLQAKPVSSISNQNNLSDFIPVNKVEFPSDGELGVRFGERLKRRERGRHLIPQRGATL